MRFKKIKRNFLLYQRNDILSSFLETRAEFEKGNLWIVGVNKGKPNPMKYLNDSFELEIWIIFPIKLIV